MAKSVTTIPATLSRFTAAPINSTKKRRVAAYARVSTDNEEQLTSYEAQVDYYTNYIQGRDDWEFAGVYTDVYNLKMIPFDTLYTVQTPKITAFEGKNACRKPLFLFFGIMLPDCRVHQCTQQTRGGCICTQAK